MLLSIHSRLPTIVIIFIFERPNTCSLLTRRTNILHKLWCSLEFHDFLAPPSLYKTQRICIHIGISLRAGSHLQGHLLSSNQLLPTINWPRGKEKGREQRESRKRYKHSYILRYTYVFFLNYMSCDNDYCISNLGLRKLTNLLVSLLYLNVLIYGGYATSRSTI